MYNSHTQLDINVFTCIKINVVFFYAIHVVKKIKSYETYYRNLRFATTFRV